MSAIKEKIKIYLELAKVRITIAVSITTVAGYVMASGALSFRLLVVVSGIFLLACGSSVINHIQDWQYDLRMGRTSSRPLPAGKISRTQAWIFAWLLTFSGTLLLYFSAGILPMLLGWLAMFWYNVVYTYTKRVTPYAVIPGSVIGAIPPVIGWISAGGHYGDPRMMVMSLFFFIWQVPHFWLLMVKYGKQYEEAGFPTLTAQKNEAQIFGMIYLWVLATFIITVFLPFAGVVRSLPSSLGLWISALYLLWVFSRRYLKRHKSLTPMQYFMRINYFVLAAVLFMLLDPLFV